MVWTGGRLREVGAGEVSFPCGIVFFRRGFVPRQSDTSGMLYRKLAGNLYLETHETGYAGEGHDVPETRRKERGCTDMFTNAGRTGSVK